MHQSNDTNWKELGNKHFENKEYLSAIESYNKAISLNANYKEPFLNKGLCYIELNNHNEALAALNQAILLDASYTKAVFNKVKILAEKNSFQAAVETIDLYSANGGDNHDILKERKDFAAKAVKELLGKGVSTTPQDLINQAKQHKKDRNIPLAIKYIKAVLILDTKHDEAAKFLAELEKSSITDSVLQEKTSRKEECIPIFHNGVNHFSGLSTLTSLTKENDNCKYEGQLKNGKRHGIGKLICSVNNKILVLVADWDNDKTKLIYTNTILSYFSECYLKFKNSLNAFTMLNKFTWVEQIEKLQILALLLEQKQLPEVELLELMFKQDIENNLTTNIGKLLEIHNLYNKLNKEHLITTEELFVYRAILEECFITGFFFYYDEKIKPLFNKGFISYQEIAENILIKPTKICTFKEIKHILSIKSEYFLLFKNLLEMINHKISSVDILYRDEFIKHQKKLLQELWQSLSYSTENKLLPVDNLDSRINIFKELYRNYLEVFPFIIDLYSNICDDNSPTFGVYVKVNDLCNHYKIINSNYSGLTCLVVNAAGIVQDSMQFASLSEQEESNQFIKFIDSIATGEVLSVFALPNFNPGLLHSNVKIKLKELGSKEIERLQQNKWVFVTKKGAGRIGETLGGKEEKISCTSVATTLHLFQTEHIKTKNNINISLGSIFDYKVYDLNFKVMNEFKPWGPVNYVNINNILKANLTAASKVNDVFVGFVSRTLALLLEFSKKKSKDAATSDWLDININYIITVYKDKTNNHNIDYRSIIEEIRKVTHYFISFEYLSDQVKILQAIDVERIVAVNTKEVTSYKSEYLMTQPWDIKTDSEEQSSDDIDIKNFLSDITIDEEINLKDLQHNPITIFFEENLDLNLSTKKNPKITGKYSGTCSVINYKLSPSGFGEWKYSGNKQHEVIYQGEWQNGLWHGYGNFFEFLDTGNMQISVKIPQGKFESGKLSNPDDVYGDSVMTIITKDSYTKRIELHFYGQMREDSNNTVRLQYLQKTLFASHFYFQDQKYRKVFTKGGQIHIIRDDRDNETGYQLKGEWKIEQQGQKLHHIYVNDFADHKNNFIKEIKEEIQNFLLKSDEYSRYSMLNFYKKIINTNNNLEIFLTKVLDKNNKNFVSQKLTDKAHNLKELLDLSKEIKEYVPYERDNTTVPGIKTTIESYIKTDYTNWLQSHNQYELVPGDIVTKLLINPNMLQMTASIRELIGNHYNIAPTFKKAEGNNVMQVDFMEGGYVNAHMDRNFCQLIHFDKDNNYYRGDIDTWKQRVDKIKIASDEYLQYFLVCLKIIIKQDSSSKLGKKILAGIYEKFYNQYVKMFQYKLHLNKDNEIIKYQEWHKDLIKQTINNLINNDLPKNKLCTEINLVATFLNKELGYERIFNIAYTLGVMEYYSTVKEIFSGCNKNLDNNVPKIVEKQIDFFSRLGNNSGNINRIVDVFNELLLTYVNTTKQQNIFSNSTDIQRLMQEINNKIIKHLTSVIDLTAKKINEDSMSNMCDTIGKQKSFIANIGYLPLFIKGNPIEEFKDEAGQQGVWSVKECSINSYLLTHKPEHFSYTILDEALKILDKLLLSNNGPNKIKDKDKVKIYQDYYDILLELIKQFDKQLDVNSLEDNKAKKIAYLEHCEKITEISGLRKYLSSLKKYISITENQVTISLEEALTKFKELNKDISEERFEQLKSLYASYNNKFNIFKSQYLVGDISTVDIVSHIKYVKSSGVSQSNIKITNANDAIKYQQNVAEDLLTCLAGIGWILTVAVSGMADKDGKLDKNANIGIQLSPHVIQIMGCIILLGLDLNISTYCNAAHWLPKVPKKIAEVLTGQGKSWQISLLSMLYALYDYRVTVACYSSYLSQRDKKELTDHFQTMKDEVGKISFKTLQQLAEDEIEGGNYKEGEKIASLVKQIVYNGEYKGEVSELADQASSADKHILILDEADTVISSELSNSLNRVELIYDNKILADAIEEMYDAAKKGTAKDIAIGKFGSDLMKDAKIRQMFTNYPIISNKCKEECWQAATDVVDYYKDNSETKKIGAWHLDINNNPLYRLTEKCDGVERYSENKWSARSFRRYYNAFFYLALFEKQAIVTKKNPDAYGYIMLPCGSVYYSTIVAKLSNTLLLGVTGSLRKRSDNEDLLCVAEQEVLGKDLLGVKKEDIIYFPSLVGESRLTFDPSKAEYFKIINSKDEWHAALANTAKDIADKGGAVVIFFKNESDLRIIFNKLQVKRPFQLTNDIISIDIHGNFKSEKIDEVYKKNECSDWVARVDKLASASYAGKSGAITLAIADYGRGTNFVASDVVNKNGGLQIVQSWFAEDPKDEVQVMGRTARNGESGIYRQIIQLEDLKKHTFHENISTDVITLSTAYHELKDMAKNSMQARYAKLKDNIALNKDKSEQTLTWLHDARKDRAIKLNSNQPSVIDDRVKSGYALHFK